jgi:WD40 repeat protein
MLAIQLSDATITLWNINGNGDQISSITLVNNYLSLGYTGELTFSPDNKYLASSRSAGEITLWSIPDGSVFNLNTPATDGQVYKIVFGDSGNKLAAEFGNEIALWGIPNNSSSTFYVHATSDNYIDAKPIPKATANDVPGLQSPNNAVRVGNIDLDTAAPFVPFPIMVPAHLPESIKFKSASVNNDGSVLLFYEVGNQEGLQASLFIYEQSIRNSTPSTMTIGADASVMLTHVSTNTGNALAEFVQGDWTWRQSYTPPNGNSLNGVTHDVWDWDGSSSTERLRWRQNSTLIGLYYQVYNPYSPVLYTSTETDQIFNLSSILDQADLVQIGSGMVPYSAVNTDKTSYNLADKNTFYLNLLKAMEIGQSNSAASIAQKTLFSNGFVESK